MSSITDIVSGTTRRHLTRYSNGIYVHKNVLSKFEEFSSEAKAAGFSVKIISAYRDFNSQLKIWNEKTSGNRPVFDPNGKEVDIKKLSGRKLIFAILEWSALPGTSRHHWGTDFDIIADNLSPNGYKVKLLPTEGEKGGVFYEFNNWLTRRLPLFGFYRPYQTYRGGVRPEWWHVSYAPLSELYIKEICPKIVKPLIKESSINLKEEILEQLDEIFEKFIYNVDTPLEKK